jgi:hypothetical protein
MAVRALRQCKKFVLRATSALRNKKGRLSGLPFLISRVASLL